MAKQLKQDIDHLRLSADVRPRSSRTSPPLPGRGREPLAHSAGLPAPVSSAHPAWFYLKLRSVQAQRRTLS